MPQYRRSHLSFAQVHRAENLNIFISTRCEFFVFPRIPFWPSFSIPSSLEPHALFLWTGHTWTLGFAPLLSYGLCSSIQQHQQPYPFCCFSTILAIPCACCPDHPLGGGPSTATSVLWLALPLKPLTSRPLWPCRASFLPPTPSSLPPYSHRKGHFQVLPEFSQRAHRPLKLQL